MLFLLGLTVGDWDTDTRYFSLLRGRIPFPLPVRIGKYAVDGLSLARRFLEVECSAPRLKTKSPTLRVPSGSGVLQMRSIVLG